MGNKTSVADASAAVGDSEEQQQTDAEPRVAVYVPPENDYQLVFESIKDLEYILQVNFESNGEDLHSMLSSTNRKLPTNLILDMRQLATIRNNMAYEKTFDKLEKWQRKQFIDKYRKCVATLEDEIRQRAADEAKFHDDIVREHRILHPLPNFTLEEEKAQQTTSRGLCIACF